MLSGHRSINVWVSLRNSSSYLWFDYKGRVLYTSGILCFRVKCLIFLIHFQCNINTLFCFNYSRTERSQAYLELFWAKTFENSTIIQISILLHHLWFWSEQGWISNVQFNNNWLCLANQAEQSAKFALSFTNSIKLSMLFIRCNILILKGYTMPIRMPYLWADNILCF